MHRKMIGRGSLLEPIKVTYMSDKYYKVLVGGKSCHGGDMTWSLPSDKEPGEWHAVDGKIVLCQTGLHVTTDPNHWWKDGCSVYEVEIDGEIGGRDDEKAKIVVPKARLLTLVKVLKIDGKWQIEQEVDGAMVHELHGCKSGSYGRGSYDIFSCFNALWIASISDDAWRGCHYAADIS